MTKRMAKINSLRIDSILMREYGVKHIYAIPEAEAHKVIKVAIMENLRFFQKLENSCEKLTNEYREWLGVEMMRKFYYLFGISKEQAEYDYHLKFKYQPTIRPFLSERKVKYDYWDRI